MRQELRRDCLFLELVPLADPTSLQKEPLARLPQAVSGAAQLPKVSKLLRIDSLEKIDWPSFANLQAPAPDRQRHVQGLRVGGRPGKPAFQRAEVQDGDALRGGSGRAHVVGHQGEAVGRRHPRRAGRTVLVQSQRGVQGPPARVQGVGEDSGRSEEAGARGGVPIAVELHPAAAQAAIMTDSVSFGQDPPGQLLGIEAVAEDLFAQEDDREHLGKPRSRRGGDELPDRMDPGGVAHHVKDAHSQGSHSECRKCRPFPCGWREPRAPEIEARLSGNVAAASGQGGEKEEECEASSRKNRIGRHIRPYPTPPSRLTARSFWASTANSMGSSLKTCLQKPFTMRCTASSAERPRLCRKKI